MILSLALSLLCFQNRGVDVQEKQRVEYVLLDIAAYNKNGDPVTNLKASDFVVSENRKKVKPNFFEVLDFRRDFEIQGKLKGNLQEVMKEATRPAQQVALVLDFELLQYENLMRAFNEVESFLQNLDPAYRYKIFIYSLDKGPLTEGFTEDLDAVQRALIAYRAQYLGYRKKNQHWDTDNPIASDGPKDRPGQKLEVLGSAVNEDGVRAGSGGNMHLPYEIHHARHFEARLRRCLRRDIDNPNPCECIETTLEDFLHQLSQRTEFMTSQLLRLAARFEGTDDLKTMFLLSTGFIVDDVTAIHDLADDYRRRADCGLPATTARSGVQDLDRNLDQIIRTHKMELETDFREVLHACISNRVMFNTIYYYNDFNYPGGRTGGLREEFFDRHVAGLRTLSEGSGGTINRGFDIDTAITNSLARGRFFYVVGYNSPSGRPGKYREIKVKVKRRGVSLRYRKGYFSR